MIQIFDKMSAGSLAQLKPVSAMVSVNFAFAVANILIKKILELGADHLVIVAYRQLASAILISPIAYVLERCVFTRVTTCYALSFVL